ncbi:hypothetical protein A5657_03795 [Mycobacterium kubicae]|nr:hypothetical protein A5657_03795 [Mycobacterium kubicae]
MITTMIVRERSTTGSFNFGRFYVRRFKRLTPALSLMVAVTMVMSCCLLSPFDVQQAAAQTGLGALLLVANFVIALNTGDYFAAPAELNPLLHTWSLSVEEQFYLLFPTILLFGWGFQRDRRRIPWLAVIVGAVALTSFWLAVRGMWALGPLAPPRATYLVGFYGPLSRAWEFAVGALLALATTSRSPVSSDKQASFLAWLGLGLLAVSTWMIKGATPFPSPWTLLPVCGTLLVIAAGTHHTTWVSRALALPPIVKFGDWSYSIYLWHWPLKVFAVHLWPGVAHVETLAVTLSIVPAIASYHWVEQPLRRLPPMTKRRTTAVISAVVGPSVLLAATSVLAAVDYWMPRYASGAVPITHKGGIGWNEFYSRLTDTYYPCSDQAIRDNAAKWKDINRCGQSKPGPSINIALVGDSHAEVMFLGLAKALPTKNVVYYIEPGPPVRSTPGMARIIDHVAADRAINTVIVTAKWALHGIAVDQLVDTLSDFRSQGKEVFITDDLPMFGFDAVDCKYRIAPVLPVTKCSEDRGMFEAQYREYYPPLRAAVAKVPGVQLLGTAHYFCDDRVCSMNNGQTLLYRDSNHLNNEGSDYLIDRMLTDFPQLRSDVLRP